MPDLTVAVIVASLGRPQALGELLEDLRRQSVRPTKIVLSVTAPEDVPPAARDYPEVEVILGPKGSCVQRNTAIDRLDGNYDIIAFLDDDYVPSRFMIERAIALFSGNPEVAGTTGHLLADGVNGPGIAIDEARALLRQYDERQPPPAIPYRDLEGLYGCNMVFRANAIRNVRFDERLPLYGWQEDIDFSAQVAAHGRTVKTFAFAGVHRGVKTGRSSGVRIGYSQVVNPVYLVRKGTMPPRYAAKIVFRNVLANHIRAFRPEAWIDRFGRARGNWIGFFDIARGKITPWAVERL